MTDNPISEFSREFARHLRGVMREHDITGAALATRLHRSEAFISERTGGRRPADTDIIDAVAELAGTDTSGLVGEIARRMQEGGAPRKLTPARAALERGRARRRAKDENQTTESDVSSDTAM